MQIKFQHIEWIRKASVFADNPASYAESLTKVLPPASSLNDILANICTVQAPLHESLRGHEGHAQRQQHDPAPAHSLCPRDGHPGQQRQTPCNLHMAQHAQHPNHDTRVAISPIAMKSKMSPFVPCQSLTPVTEKLKGHCGHDRAIEDPTNACNRSTNFGLSNSA